jgi:hypothetical protein
MKTIDTCLALRWPAQSDTSLAMVSGIGQSIDVPETIANDMACQLQSHEIFSTGSPKCNG